MPPVNASRTASRQCPAHDSGSVWIATPSLYRIFTVYLLPVFPAHRGSMAGLYTSLPTLRRHPRLAEACAWLEADVDRYSFIVMDLYQLLLAGLPAHSLSFVSLIHTCPEVHLRHFDPNAYHHGSVPLQHELFEACSRKPTSKGSSFISHAL